MTVDRTATRVLQSFKCPKYDKTCFLSLVKHSCWTAIFLGSIMLGLGLVLRSSLVNAPSPTVSSSGLLFIVIGVFIICMGPFAAVYDLLCREHTSNRNGIHAESGLVSSNISQSSDLPSYSQVMTGLKTPSATYTMGFTQLSAKKLSENQPQPPSYEEIVGQNLSSSPNIPESTPDVRRMTVP